MRRAVSSSSSSDDPSNVMDYPPRFAGPRSWPRAHRTKEEEEDEEASNE